MSKRRKRSRTTIDIIRELKAETISPSDVTPNMRRACVQRLRMDGITHEEIADLFGVHPKTIGRDVRAIRQSAALRLSPDLKAEFFGEFRLQVDTAISRLRRLERDPAATPADRIAANKAIIEIFDLFIQRLVQCGYLSTAQEARPASVDVAELLNVAAVVLSEFGVESPLGRQIKELVGPYGDLPGSSGIDAA